MKSAYHLLFIVLCIVSSFTLYADNLRQMSSNEGLSNSSVVCILQDSRRFLWIGTYDGLNMYDGRNIHVYKPEINNPNSLSSNVIRGIVETDNNYLWIVTKWGLNKFSKRNNNVEAFYKEFKDDAYSVKDSHDNLFVLGKQGALSLYHKSEKRFIDLPIHSEITCERVGNVSIDSQDVIWINHAGVLERYAVSLEDSLNPQIKRLPDYAHPRAVDYLFNSNRGLIIIDAEGNLYTVTPEKQTFLKNISPLIRECGIISSVIFDGEDLLIGFKTNGLVRLLSQSNYKTEKIDINCGVFALKKDEKQDILWIGSNGPGLNYYSFHTKKIHSFINSTPNAIKNVHALLPDTQDSLLWVGAGSTLLKVHVRNKQDQLIAGYTKPFVFDVKNKQHYNQIYSLYRESDTIIWVGIRGNGIVR